MTYPKPSKIHLLFAFGSNLNLNDLESWFHRNDLTAPRILKTTPAWCPDYEPVYHYYSSGRQGGALDLREAPGQLTPGALLQVDEDTLQAIDRKEGAGSYYQRHTVTVLTANGRKHQAITYLTLPERRRMEHVPPSEDYAKIVRLGQQVMGHDPLPVEQAALGQPITPVINALFVYGTLMQGECREHCLDSFGIKERNIGRVPGRLIDLGSYPGLCPATTPADWVWGEYVVFEDIQGALQRADGIEGFEGFAHPNNLYERRLIQVTLAEGRQQLAWVYFYHRPAKKAFIESGHWNPTVTYREAEVLEPFALCSELSINAFEKQVAVIASATRRLAEGSLSAQQAAMFAENLINSQRNGNPQPLKPGSWCVVPDDEFLPSDARVDFAFMPTYWALAFLCRFQLEYPQFANNLQGLDNAIDLGLEFASYRKLSGHGYEGNQQRLQAVEILLLGRLPEWFRHYPKRGTVLKLALNQAIRDFRNIILQDANQGWSPLAEDALARVCQISGN